jgi:hypothetical protein
MSIDRENFKTTISLMQSNTTEKILAPIHHMPANDERVAELKMEF